MNVQLNPVSATRKNLVVTLEPGEVDAEHRAVLGEFVRHARLPGFRPGHAPAAVVAKRYGKEVAEELKQKVVARAYQGALEKEKLDVVSIVDVQEGAVAPGTAATITVVVDLRPDFALPDYKSLPTEVQPTDVTEAEVDGAIEALRADRADFSPADRPARKGDYVKLSYAGSLEGKPIAELAPDRQLYGQVPQTWEEVEGEQGGVVPGLGQKLAGLRAGDRRTVAISFPADFAAVPALAGRTADYAVEVLEVRERVLPAVDAEFLQAHGAKSLEELKERTRAALQGQKEARNRAVQRRQVTEAAAALADFPLPDSLVSEETQSVLSHFIEENMRRGVPAEQFEKDKKQIFEQGREAAARRVKLRLVLEKIAAAEKIEAARPDFDDYIHREAARTRQRPEKVAQELEKNPNALRSAQQAIVFDKTVDFLVANAKVTIAHK